MPGIITPPVAATSATAVPDTPPNSIESATLAMASPPRIQPTIALANRMMRSVMPPKFIRFPARMKPGMHSNTNTSIPAYMRCGMITTGSPAARM